MPLARGAVSSVSLSSTDLLYYVEPLPLDQLVCHSADTVRSWPAAARNRDMAVARKNMADLTLCLDMQLAHLAACAGAMDNSIPHSIPLMSAETQIKRDQARVAEHKRQQSTVPRMTTRSMATCLPTEPCVTDRDAHVSEIEEVRDDNNGYSCMDPLEISLTPLCQPSCNAHDDSLMSKGDDCNSPCVDVFPRPSSPCIDTPLASRDLECTSLAIPPMLPSPSSDSDSDDIDKSVSSDTSLACSRHDHDTTVPETELCDIDMATLISALRSEMRSVVGEFRLSDKFLLLYFYR